MATDTNRFYNQLMLHRSNLAKLTAAVLLSLASLPARAEAPAAALSAVPIQSVQIDDPFWSPKMNTWRTVTMTDCLDRFDRDGAMENFDHVARGEMHAEHKQFPWFDGLVYEMIQAGADFIAESPDPQLEARLDGMIDRIAAAGQHDPDGYLNTYTSLKEPTHRWGLNGGNDRWQHDLYNAGCLVDAGVHYYRATGKTKLLATAVRMSNYMSREMGPPPRKNAIPGHAVGEEAEIGLYSLFKEQPDLKQKLGVPVDEQKYLELAQFWIDARGHHEGRGDYGAYDQDHIPVLQQTTIEGHAVRAALMASGLTRLGIATERSDYANVARTLWDNMVSRRAYLTGAVGADANDEKFSSDFVLPNTGYAETCAAVANGFFSRNINLATADASAADEYELALYNGALAGVALSGKGYFYENPLESTPKRTRWDWHACPCCPPMFLKMMSGLPGTIYATGETSLYINQFVGSTAKLQVHGTPLVVTQQTRYPWDGDLHLTITPTTPATFDLMLRIPGWSSGQISHGGLYRVDGATSQPPQITVNGQPVEHVEMMRGYARISRAWQSGDRVDLHLPMNVRRVSADSHVDADRGRVALMRGPIVYCVESIDHDGSIADLWLPSNAAIEPQARPDLLGGLTVLGATDGKGKAFTAIPYFANANRGPVSMEVWLPIAPGEAKGELLQTPAATTRPTFLPAGAPPQ